MKKQELYQKVLDIFQKSMPTAETELHYESPFQLLVAVILSAQCTDKRVNMVTPALFEVYPTAQTMATAQPDEVFEWIKSISFPHNKARHLVGMAQKLMSDFNGEVPSTLDDLVQLPGVGRKTANVIQAVVFDKATMAVDTHVFRVSHRMGLVSARCNTPYKVEMELMRYIPKEWVPKAHHWLLLHGRYTCTARNPKCGDCPFMTLCCDFKSRYKMNKTSC